MPTRRARTTVYKIHLAMVSALCLIASVALAAPASGPETAVINIGGQRQVFIDGRFMAESKECRTGRASAPQDGGAHAGG